MVNRTKFWPVTASNLEKVLFHTSENHVSLRHQLR